MQNLIRVEPYTQRGNITYQLKNDGSTEEIVDTMLDIKVNKQWNGEQPDSNIKIYAWILLMANRNFITY